MRCNIRHNSTINKSVRSLVVVYFRYRLSYISIYRYGNAVFSYVNCSARHFDMCLTLTYCVWSWEFLRHQFSVRATHRRALRLSTDLCNAVWPALKIEWLPRLGISRLPRRMIGLRLTSRLQVGDLGVQQLYGENDILWLSCQLVLRVA